MSLDVAFDDTQEAIATSLLRFCEARCSPEVVKSGAGGFQEPLWRDLADLGVLAIATDEGDGGPREAVAAMETLGFAAFPGPLAATFLATQLVDAEERHRLVTGQSIVSVGRSPLFPFASIATIFLEIDDEHVYRAQPRHEIEPLETLGGESWGRVDCVREERLDDGSYAISLYRVALAAYLAGTGDALVRAASRHAATRRQFGQSIGRFQAVSHPLAETHIGLEGARLLARSAADRLANDLPDAANEARAAHHAARRAAIEAAHVCHQVFGAVGITLEGPAFHFSRRILQLAALAPRPEPTAERLYADLSGASRERGVRP